MSKRNLTEVLPFLHKRRHHLSRVTPVAALGEEDFGTFMAFWPAGSAFTVKLREGFNAWMVHYRQKSTDATEAVTAAGLRNWRRPHSGSFLQPCRSSDGVPVFIVHLPFTSFPDPFDFLDAACEDPGFFRTALRHSTDPAELLDTRRLNH